LKGGWSAAINPYEIQRQLESAIEHHKGGRPEDAERGYRQVLQKVPNQPDALNLLAVLAVEAGNHAAAADLFERAVAVRPKDPVILNNYGNALSHARRFEEAIQTLEQALALNPDMADAWLNLGRALNMSGRPEDSLRALRQLLKIKPDSSGALTGMARAYTELGQFDMAEEIARALIERTPESALGYVPLANIRKFKAADPELIKVETLATNKDLSPADRRGLAYAAGKMCDDAGRYDDAYRYYDEANAARGLVYDHEAIVKDYDQSIRVFTKKFFKAREGWGSDSKRPIFIVGMPRSGTTLVETILGAHPQVFAAGELETIKRLSRTMGDIVPEDRGGALNVQQLSWYGAEICAQRYLDVIKRKNATVDHVTDKLPHNFQELGLIALLFPNARIVHCKRHPLDTLLSCWMQNFNDGHAYSANLTDGARHYREYLRLMEHWRAVLPTPIHDVEYEAMVGDQELTTRELLDFVRLPWDERCMSFHKVERTVMTASIWQVRQPLYTRSKGRWMNYERHLGPVREILGV
jgi:tetratricopeptide (TPR) repeat protein